MKLLKVEIEAYKSITNKLELVVEPNITVVLGPNDHGKTNILSAIAHLNADNPFSPETDLNWDKEDRSDLFPFIRWEFTLDEDSRRALASLWRQTRPAGNPPTTEPTQTPATVTPAPDTMATEQNEAASAGTSETTEMGNLDEGAGNLPSAEVSEADLMVRIPTKVAFYRRGLSSSLTLEDGEAMPDDVQNALLARLPRVEIIRASERVADSVTASEIISDGGAFMRGIFYYAGLDPLHADELFAQTPSTEKKLSTASGQLDRHLKETWSQGESLSFLLRHHSATQSIRLMIDDPNVSKQYTFASHRSAGFTNYFAIKTILHARQQEHRAASHIWLFDEPGLYLHPAGQFDLLRTLETLGSTSQLLYVTHSLFLINKTFPTRHRLILKAGKGTVIEGKPYVGRWGRALSALGLTLSGTILFANHVILTEGDSDPIYIEALLQHFIRNGKLTADINSLAVMATGEGRNAEALTRLLMETQPAPTIAILFDGDAGGRERYEDIKAMLEHFKIAHRFLVQDQAIEDYLPQGDALYVHAVANYAAKLCKDRGIEDHNISENAETSFKEAGNISRAKWAADFVKATAKLKSSPSKVGIAREYVLLLQELDEAGQLVGDHKKMLELLKDLETVLQLPKPLLTEGRILAS